MPHLHSLENRYWAPVGGESMADLCTRIRHFLSTLSECSAGLRVVVVCHYRTIHAFRILLEEIPQEGYPALLREKMPNGCVWWYSRRDPRTAAVHWQICSGRKIEVGLCARPKPPPPSNRASAFLAAQAMACTWPVSES